MIPGMTMHRKTSIINWKTAAISLILLFCLQPTSLAQEARLAHIIVTNTRDHLMVYLNVEGAFREEIKNAISSGVPVSFSFLIELYENRNLWPDKKLAAKKITHTVHYNNLKKEYSIKRSWDTGEPAVTKSFENAKALMTEIDGLKVVPLSNLEKDKRYQLRAKAELSKRTLPFYLHYVLFFVSLWDFETDWYAIDFTY